MASISNPFPLFMSFPPEIHSLIMSACPDNDMVCLRLSCKYLYSLSPNQNKIRLDNNDDPILCNSPDLSNKTRSEIWRHRNFSDSDNCHQISYEAVCKRKRELGLPVPKPRKCQANNYWKQHCECFNRESRLYVQLRSWMPKNLRYCPNCVMYTKKRKDGDPRCYHGRPKPRKATDNFWTHRRGRGAFGYRIWKKWFNNAAMNQMEKRLRTQAVSRGGNGRYALRELKATEIDTGADRGML